MLSEQARELIGSYPEHAPLWERIAQLEAQLAAEKRITSWIWRNMPNPVIDSLHDGLVMAGLMDNETGETVLEALDA